MSKIDTSRKVSNLVFPAIPNCKAGGVRRCHVKDVRHVNRFKRGDNGVLEKVSAVHSDSVYLIWERDISRLPGSALM
jgi:hypothetical protein